MSDAGTASGPGGPSQTFPPPEEIPEQQAEPQSPQPPSPPDEPAPVWLRRTDQAVVGVLVALGFVFLGIHLWRMGALHGEAVEIERLPETASQYRLPVNTATWVEWAQLDGIGETLARRIVADREAHGPFQSLTDLGRVKGLGPKTLEKIQRWLVFD